MKATELIGLLKNLSPEQQKMDVVVFLSHEGAYANICHLDADRDVVMHKSGLLMPQCEGENHVCAFTVIALEYDSELDLEVASSQLPKTKRGFWEKFWDRFGSGSTKGGGFCD